MAQIRVLGFTRVTGTFDARQLCDKRRYEYILPASAFVPQAHKPRADLPLPGPPTAAAQACGKAQHSLSIVQIFEAWAQTVPTAFSVLVEHLNRNKTRQAPTTRSNKKQVTES